MKTVIVKMSNGAIYRGPVSSLRDFGTTNEPDRYIEFTHDAQSDGRTGDPGYLKEQYDRQHQGVVTVEVVL
jgi:hypothetical protein